MSLLTFTDLKNAALNWLARSNDSETSAAMDDLVALAEKRIYYGAGQSGTPLYSPPFRCRYNEKLADLTIDAQEVNLPTDYLAFRRLYCASLPHDLQYWPVDEFWKRAAENTPGAPRFYTIEGEKIFFDRIPDQSYTGKMNYFYIPDPLSDTNPTNAVFLKFPNLYLYATLLETACFIDEEAAQNKWYGKYAAAIIGIMAQNEADRFGAAPIVMRAG